MALNMDKVRNKLASYDKTKKGGKKLTLEQQDKADKIKKYIWKPEPGKQVVRIVPYQCSPDFPFIELKWHYNFNGDNISYLSPSSFNETDPIVELANRLEKIKESWLKGRKMQPKIRTYVPIIVRGKEEEGVKFWGFGARVHEQLLAAISEPEYGDITDLVSGNDITVDFKTAEELKADFPDTKILIKPTKRPVIDQENPKAREILELITRKQPDITSIYKPATYDELAAALEVRLENERNGETANTASRGAERTASSASPARPAVAPVEETVVVPTEDEIAANTPAAKIAEIVAEASAPVSPSATKANTNKANLNMSAEDFEEAFRKVTGKK